MRSTTSTLLVLALLAGATYGADWPQWRGPSRDAVSADTGLLQEWPKEGPPLLWESKAVNADKPIGVGYSSPAVQSGKIYVMGDVASSKEEGVHCLELATGKHLWSTKIGTFFQHGVGSGGRGTPTVDGARLYVLTPKGVLICLESENGSILWQKDLPKEFGGKMMSGWGYSESPLIDGDRVVCTPGGKKAAMVALQKETGNVIWTCELPKDSGSGYASIVIAKVGGIKQYLTYLGKDPGLIGVNASNGQLLWTYSGVANGTANIPTPIVKDDYVFTSTSYGAGAALLRLVPTSGGGIEAKEQYQLTNKQVNNHHGGMVMVGDYVYGGSGQNQGNPFCVEWKTGKLAWGPERGPGSGSAAVIYADGNLVFRYQGGTVALIEATPKALTVKSTFEAKIGTPNWAHPVIADGKLLLRGDDTIRCYNLRK